MAGRDLSAINLGGNVFRTRRIGAGQPVPKRAGQHQRRATSGQHQQHYPWLSPRVQPAPENEGREGRQKQQGFDQIGHALSYPRAAPDVIGYSSRSTEASVTSTEAVAPQM